MRRRPPRSTRTDPLFPYTPLFRSPGELVLADRLLERPEIAEAFAGLKDRLTPLPAARFDSANGVRRLEELFEVKALDAFGAFGRAELAAAGALVDYVALTQKGRSEERRVGKECVSTCRARCAT